MENNNFTIEENKKFLANSFLERLFFSRFRKDSHSTLAIYLTGRCNQKCEYCYIHKYGKKIYPDVAHNKENILLNLEKIMKWYVKNRFCCEISIFSADFIQDVDFSNKVFETIFNILKNAGFRDGCISIPSNMSWINSEKALNQMLNWINKYEKELDVRLTFSCSIDGKYCDDLRAKHTDEFYKKLFDLALKYDWGFHPMISALDSDKWIDNINWWKNETPEGIFERIGFLEVRNEQWTDEYIENYCKFVSYCIKNYICNDIKTDEDKVNILKTIMHTDKLNCRNPLTNLFKLLVNGVFDGNDGIPCSFNTLLTIRAGDLAVPYCHRLAYDELILGNFEVDENGEINNFKPKNVEGLISKVYLRKSCLPYCESCIFNPICGGFCLGNAYEENKDMFVPVMENCNLQKAKIITIIKELNNYGILSDDIFLKAYNNEEVNSKENKYLRVLRDSIILGGNKNE